MLLYFVINFNEIVKLFGFDKKRFSFNFCVKCVLKYVTPNWDSQTFTLVHNISPARPFKEKKSTSAWLIFLLLLSGFVSFNNHQSVNHCQIMSRLLLLYFFLNAIRIRQPRKFWQICINWIIFAHQAIFFAEYHSNNGWGWYILLGVPTPNCGNEVVTSEIFGKNIIWYHQKLKA